MTKSGKKIGVDLDDVLLDCHSALCEFHNKRYGAFQTADQKKFYDLERLWNCTREEAIKRMEEFYHSDEHANALPIIGAPEAVRELSKNNLLVIVTVKPDFLREKTLKWLDKYYQDSFDGLYFTNHFLGDGAKKTKVEVCDELGVETFIDDSIVNATDIGKSGREVLLFDAPWNQGEVPVNTTRVLSWKEILEKLG